jgi:Na+/H+ antiporter NhaD/arsenite permease-like protein
MNATGISLGPIPLDFILFACILLGIALFHGKTLQIAVVGLIVVVLYKFGFTGFKDGPGIAGLMAHLKHEWIIIANLLGLLLGFALLSKHFEDSGLPQKLPDVLPDGRLGAFALLVIVFVMSAFLDNIAAALIGGAMAKVVFKSKLHIGYLAAIVAASNAGGSGSVVGDTTTTMMWIDGVSPRQVLDAYIAAVTALLFFGFFAARQQHQYNPIMKDAATGAVIDWGRIGVCVFILLVAIAANVICNLKFPAVLEHFPVIGTAVWIAILLTAVFRKPDWKLLPDAFKGSVFLLSLVVIASLMPVEKLPSASWPTTLGLGFVSSVFDNIPLTALALKQGGYDWGMLAFAVGFGGSMIWFGSTAGVALANTFPEARSVGAWIKGGWHVAVAYVLGFGVMLLVSGWNPEPRPKDLKKLTPKATPAASITAPSMAAVAPLSTLK